jgi:hypothetical protein
MGRPLVCALFFCLLPAAAGATSELSPADQSVQIDQYPALVEVSSDIAGLPADPAEYSAESTTFAYRVRHGAQPLPEMAFDALWFGGDQAAPPRVAVAEPIAAIPANTARYIPTRAALCDHAAVVAARHDLPAPFFANLIQQESGFRSYAVSPVGAQGIAQFMPRTARAYGLENPFDPLHSMAVSAKFLRELLAQFGNLGLAAAAYNAGPKRVQDWMKRRGKLPEETRNYVRNITGQPAERWARVKAPTEDKALPAHARCPNMPTIEVSVPAPAPVKTARSKAKAKVAAKATTTKDKKAYTLATIASAKKAIIKDGKIKILSDGKKTKPVPKSAAKSSNKPAKKVAAKPDPRQQAKAQSKPKVKVAEAR